MTSSTPVPRDDTRLPTPLTVEAMNAEICRMGKCQIYLEVRHPTKESKRTKTCRPTTRRRREKGNSFIVGGVNRKILQQRSAALRVSNKQYALLSVQEKPALRQVLKLSKMSKLVQQTKGRLLWQNSKTIINCRHWKRIASNFTSNDVCCLPG